MLKMLNVKAIIVSKTRIRAGTGDLGQLSLPSLWGR